MRGAGSLSPALGQIVFGHAETARRLPPWIIATAILIHMMAGSVAWWREATPRALAPRHERPALRLDKLVEIELPKPKPEPAVAPPPPPPPPPKAVEKLRPKPIAPKPPALPPKKAEVRSRMPRAAQTEPAQAAQVISRKDDAPAAEASSFDIVTGGGERYAGGVTSPTGKSKVAVREVLASYEQVLLAWIERHKRYPRNALRRRIEGRPILEIRIDRSGRLLDYRLTESSRQAELDEAAVTLVQRASPFPAIPAHHTESTFTFRFGVNFNISGR